MVQKNILSIIALIGLVIFAYLYFTKETVIVKPDQVEIDRLKKEIADSALVYNTEITYLKDSIAKVIHNRDSVINQKNINYWYLKRKHEEELSDIMDLPDDSIVGIFTRLTTPE